MEKISVKEVKRRGDEREGEEQREYVKNIGEKQSEEGRYNQIQQEMNQVCSVYLFTDSIMY